jgi:N-dimethylarginine dimethylaminohydrolase
MDTSRRDFLKVGGLLPLGALGGGTSALAAAERKSLQRTEWDPLVEVVVGRAEGAEVPTWSDSYSAYLSPQERVFFRRNQHRQLADVAPEVAARLAEQLDGLVSALHRLGVAVRRARLLTDEEVDFSDGRQNGTGLIFPRDPLAVIGGTVIELALRLQFRRKERFSLRPVVSDLYRRGADWVSMPAVSPDPGTLDDPEEEVPFLEGGDILLAGEDILIGQSGQASNPAGIAWLRRYLGPAYRLHPVRVRPDILHLDLALNLLRPGLAVVCPAFLPDGPPAPLAGWDFIQVSEAAGLDMGANLLSVGPDRVLVEARQDGLMAELARRGLGPVPLPFDAPAGFGGGIRCATQPLGRLG